MQNLEQQAHLVNISAELVYHHHILGLIVNHDTVLTRKWYQLTKLQVVKVDELLAIYRP